MASALVAAAWWWTSPGRVVTSAVAAAIALVGTLAADAADRELGPDDGRIVIDEAAGMALALVGVPAGFAGAAVAFALFRALDIGKPPPIAWCERVRGGPGVMLDDVVAGAAAALIGAAVFTVWPSLAT
jgi:phosphatidylglycerophosphatase A